MRRQDQKNRQNSIDDVDLEIVEKFNNLMRAHFDEGIDIYKEMLDFTAATNRDNKSKWGWGLIEH